MARKFKYNGNIYDSMMSIAKKLGINRLYPRDFAKYGVEEITEVNNTQEEKLQDTPYTIDCSDGSVKFHDPTTRHELISSNGENFNRKAFVTHVHDIKYLVSYSGVVAKIENGEVEVYGTYSSETVEHLKEFLQQNGFKAESCEQIRKDYLR